MTWLPMLGQHVIISDLLKGQPLPPFPVMGLTLITLVAAALTLALTARLLDRESIVRRNGDMIENVIAASVAENREARYLRLVSEHERAIRRLASSYERDVGRRQDLVQDIWLALWQALPGFRGDCSERTFVFRIAHNRGVSHIQHWRRRRTEALDDGRACSSCFARSGRCALRQAAWRTTARRRLSPAARL